MVVEAGAVGEQLADGDGGGVVAVGHEQGVVARAHAIGPEVAAHAVAERPCFPDVNRLAARVPPQIHAGLLGQAGDLILEVVNGHDLLCQDRHAARCTILDSL